MKKNISDPVNESDISSPVLELLKHEPNSLKVPADYFDSLSPRIIEKINSQQKVQKSYTGIQFLKKPVVWAPVLATAAVAVLLIFVKPANKSPLVPQIDEYTKISMAYDASYAEEVHFAEDIALYSELENTDNESLDINKINEDNKITDEEINDYLNYLELDNVLINNQ